jgi:NADPH-dependent 2,4-dienoyl-CoA reductase/sulfur reductase-like enzyme
VPHLLVIGGSDAGIAAGLAARQHDPEWEATVVLADRYPNFSICGLPFYLSGETPDWRALAHRSTAELTVAGLQLALETTAIDLDPNARRVTVAHHGQCQEIAYDELVIATGAKPVRPSLPGIELEGVHTPHSMADAFAVHERLADITRVAVVGAGYIGCELADAFTHRRLDVAVIEALPEVLTTVDPDLGGRVRQELTDHGVRVLTGAAVTEIRSRDHVLHVCTDTRGDIAADLVIVAVGVTPNTAFGRRGGLPTGPRGAFVVDRRMATGVPHVWAAGDCVETWQPLLQQPGYLPLGTTAHKQGRVAGINAVGGDREFAGSLGTQVVQVFDLAIARTGLRHDEARHAGYAARTADVTVDDHKAYYPGATPMTLRVTGDQDTGRLLGAQILGQRTAQVAKRVDIYATAIHTGLRVDAVNDLDLSYTPPYSSPWDPVQIAARRWLEAGG